METVKHYFIYVETGDLGTFMFGKKDDYNSLEF